MRMLCCPSRLPLSASNRLPGGDARSRSSMAISNCRSFRCATRSKPRNRLTCCLAWSCSVSFDRKDLITIECYNVTRQTSSINRKASPRLEDRRDEGPASRSRCQRNNPPKIVVLERKRKEAPDNPGPPLRFGPDLLRRIVSNCQDRLNGLLEGHRPPLAVCCLEPGFPECSPSQSRTLLIVPPMIS